MRALLLRTVDHRKIRGIWYLPVVGLPFSSLAASWALVVAFGVGFPPQNPVPPTTALVFAAVYLLAAAGEELGWSGYAVEPLQQRCGAFGAAVVLGLVWWAFHVPSILQSGEGPVLVVLGPIASVATRVLWLWLFNNTGGSVFAMILVHTVSNMCGAYVPSVPTSANAPVLVLLAALVTVLWGPGTLARSGAAAAAPRRRSDRSGP